MNIFAILSALFGSPKRVEPGTLVNQVHFGNVKRSDGVVVAHLDTGVLVEWARGGQSVVPASELAFIA